ncbi:MAG: CotH kinase family protein [Bacteroidaceae bacterium]|nr:CotH kinase family protein [Bacteroidaceae bacterium]
MNYFKMLFMVFMVSVSVNAQDANPGTNTFKSNLPIILIDTETQLTNTEKRPAHMRVIYAQGRKQYSSDETDYQFDGPVRIKLRGNSSLSFSQKKYTFETRDSVDKELDVPLLGMPAEHDWVLLAPYTDVSMMRDAFAFQLWRDMGYWAPRTVLCEVVVNGQYAGVYSLAESIKRGADRLKISKLKKTDTEGRELTGGYMLRIDTFDEDDATFTSSVAGVGQGLFMSQITWTCMYPKKKNLQPEQFDYIKNYIDAMERTFESDNYADPVNGYAKYIDVASFVDYFIHTELSLNADAYKRSAYFYKDKQNEDGSGGLLHAGTVWDYNLAYGCCSFCNADDIDAWAFEGCNTNPTPAFWTRLAHDPNFFAQVKKRYAELRRTTLSTKHLYAIIDGYASQLQQAQKRHFARFPELLGDETKRNPAGSGMMAGMGGGMPGFDMSQMPTGGFPGMMGGGFPGMMGGGFPGMMGGGFPGMMGSGFPGAGQTENRVGAVPDSIQRPSNGFPGMMPGGFGFPFNGFGRFPGGFGQQPDGGTGFPGMGQMPDMGQMPGMGQMPDMSQMPGMGEMGGMMLSWFRSYTVKNYSDEIKMLKQWLADRLAVLDDRLL